MADAAVAGALAAVVSGLPSTVHALATGRGVLDAARAAGALLGKPSAVRGGAAHVAISAGWAVVLAVVLPRRPPAVALAAGTAAGLVIAAVDLGLVGRRVPAIAALPVGPQLLDHMAFGAVVGWVLSGRRSG